MFDLYKEKIKKITVIKFLHNDARHVLPSKPLKIGAKTQVLLKSSRLLK